MYQHQRWASKANTFYSTPSLCLTTWELSKVLVFVDPMFGTNYHITLERVMKFKFLRSCWNIIFSQRFSVNIDWSGYILWTNPCYYIICIISHFHLQAEQETLLKELLRVHAKLFIKILCNIDHVELSCVALGDLG